MLTIEEFATFCKRKGLVYPSSELYGGLSGFFDYGPLGVEIKNRIKQEWWKRFVQQRADVIGLDGAIISHKDVWKASGHVSEFNDVFIECLKCKSRVRADHFIEDKLKIQAEGLSSEDLDKLVKENNLKCGNCGADFGVAQAFNLMFKTFVGPVEKDEHAAYLRPETAQLIFADFKSLVDTNRVKLPFGVAQIGKAFRNEISPRDFLFRSREFEQMEIEFFTHPDKVDDCPLLKEVEDVAVNFLSGGESSSVTVKELVEKKELSQWHGYWLGLQYKWYLDFGLKTENLRVRKHGDDELAHYATACFDIEYKFPFGWKELAGNAARGDYDLSQHQKFSKKSLSMFDDVTKEKVLPVVASEPSHGVDRAFLAFLMDSYEADGKRGNVVLKLHPSLAPVHVVVCPLVSNKEEVVLKAQEVFELLRDVYVVQYDSSASIGRRYARADEIGVPLVATVDFDGLEDNTVTLRDRDSTKQVRVSVKELKDVVYKFLVGEKFEKLGRAV
jgi:glycyl-tRNA synthetase